MKQPLKLKQPGVQVRLSEYDEKSVLCEIVTRELPDTVDSTLIPKALLRVVGSDEVMKWLDT